MTYIIVSWMDISDIAIVLEDNKPKLFDFKIDAEEYADKKVNGEYKIIKI